MGRLMSGTRVGRGSASSSSMLANRRSIARYSSTMAPCRFGKQIPYVFGKVHDCRVRVVHPQATCRVEAAVRPCIGSLRAIAAMTGHIRHRLSAMHSRQVTGSHLLRL